VSPDGARAQPAWRRTFPVLVGVVAVVLAADQLTKSWALRSLGDRERRHIIGPVHFVKRYNTGMAFSLGDEVAWTQWLVRVGVVALVTWVVVMSCRADATRRVTALFALLAAGALGNQIDRLFRTGTPVKGAVVDFIDVGFWPVFNIADAALSVAAVALIVRSFRQVPRENS
jgi:signal peptidase II